MWRVILCIFCIPLCAEAKTRTFHFDSYQKCTGFTKPDGTRIHYLYSPNTDFITKITKEDKEGERTLYTFINDAYGNIVKAFDDSNCVFLQRYFNKQNQLVLDKVRIGEKDIFEIQYYHSSPLRIDLSPYGELRYYPNKVERYNQNRELMYFTYLDNEPYLTEIDLNETKPRISDEIRLTYDENGCIIKKETPKETWVYTYDYFDRLSTASKNVFKYTYVYDPLGRLISRFTYLYEIHIDSEHYVHLENNDIAILDEIYNLKSLRLPHTPINQNIVPVSIELRKNIYSSFYDKLGRLTKLDTTEYNTSSFGRNLLTGNNAMNCPWNFAFKRTDTPTGFIYFGPRFYDPEICQWLTPDHLGEYTYSNDTPLISIKNIDRNPLFPWAPFPTAIESRNYRLAKLNEALYRND